MGWIPKDMQNADGNSAGLFSRRTLGPAAPLFSNGTMAGTPSLTDEDLGYGVNRSAREGSFLRIRE